MTKWHSQPATAQDQWIVEATNQQRGGYFVEVGGYDGLRYSNTLTLEESFDWRGLLVEADPVFFQEALVNRPKCQHLNVAAAHWTGRGLFTRADQWSGLTCYLPEDWKVEHRRRNLPEIHVNTMTLCDILEGSLPFVDPRTPKIIDYLSLDIEGIEVEVLEEYFHHPNRVIRFLTVEYLEDAGTLMRLRRILEPNGYELAKTQGWDAFFRLQ